MPNHVHNKLTFGKHSAYEGAQEVLINDEGHVDFRILIPQPITAYHGDLSGIDERDFGQFSWHSWNTTNWGTKWNAYESGKIDVNRTIFFSTAWGVPWPIIVALANTLVNNELSTAFTHYYLCEYGEWWGIEKWNGGVRLDISREDPEEFEAIFKMIHGKETWDEIMEEDVRDGLAWPDRITEGRKPEKYSRPSFLS